MRAAVTLTMDPLQQIDRNDAQIATIRSESDANMSAGQMAEVPLSQHARGL
jgi:hypothetical protein